MLSIFELANPATVIFVQSNHVYAGGDPGAFHSRFPAPVTTVVRLALELILECVSDNF
jgi:hypothetical protein